MRNKHAKPRPPGITIGVPIETHARMKREADRRGMKLREVPPFLVELIEVTTPEQQAAAFNRFMNRRPARAAAATG